MLSRVAWLMDRAWVIPGTRVSLGLDAILGLLPVGGDVLTGAVQAGLVLLAMRRYHVPPAVAARMAANVLLDVGVGAIPLVGDLFDVAFKANTRNLRLLEPYLHRKAADALPTATVVPLEGRSTRVATPWGCILPVAVALIAALALVLIGFITVVRWLFW